VRQTVQTQAVVIQRFSFGETSQVVHFLTADHGRVVVLARGAYREKNSYQGPLDLLVRGTIKVSFVRGRELGLLLQRQVETAYPALRREYRRYVAASEALRLMVEAVPVGPGDPDLFRLLDRVLQAAETVPHARLGLLTLSFEMRLLGLMGLLPHLAGCVLCGKPRSLAAYDPSEGGVVCRSCRRPDRRTVPMGRAAWELLNNLEQRPLKAVESVEPAVERAARRLLDEHLAWHLEWSAPGAHRTEPLRSRRWKRRKRA